MEIEPFGALEEATAAEVGEDRALRSDRSAADAPELLADPLLLSVRRRLACAASAAQPAPQGLQFPAVEPRAVLRAAVDDDAGHASVVPARHGLAARLGTVVEIL